MEFILKTDLQKTLPDVIDFNFEQIKSELSEKLITYKNLVVTEDSIKTGKEERAKLNKLSTALDDKRKEIKKQYLAPFEDFEKKCKELTGMISQASAAIDSQVKAFENAEKEDKRKAIELFYRDNIRDLIDLLPLQSIWQDKWLNKSVSLMSVTQEIMEIINRTKNDIGIIKAMNLECETIVLDTYLKRLNMSDALAEKNRYEERQKQLAELAALEKQNHVESVKTVEDVPAQGKQQVATYVEPVVSQPVTSDLKTIKVQFFDTTAAFRADMKALCEKHNIKYGGVK